MEHGSLLKSDLAHLMVDASDPRRWLRDVLTEQLGRQKGSRDFPALDAMSLSEKHLSAFLETARRRDWALTRVPESDEENGMCMTRGNALWLLCNAFFLNVSFPNQHGDVSLARLYQIRDCVGVERLRAFIAFLTALVDDENFARESSGEWLTAKRVVKPDDDSSWWSGDTVCDLSNVHLHEGMMEDVVEEHNAAFVDFANANIHIGSIIESATQEEVLFSSCPEMFAWMPFLRPLESDEVIVCDGAWRICKYDGYGHSYSFSGLHERPFRPQQLLIMDAAMVKHFKSSKRDLDKARLAFTACTRPAISTGAFGCGAFGGNFAHKLLQQGMACPADKRLFVSLYGRADERGKLEELIALVQQVHPSHEWMLRMMEAYADATGAEEDDDDFSAYSSKMGGGGAWFYEYAMARLNERK